MDKVWFALRQTHYPAPDLAVLGRAPSSSSSEPTTAATSKTATESDSSALLLGHIIPSPANLDLVLNRTHIHAFDASMRIFQSSLTDVSFSVSDSGTSGLALGAAAPTPAGISAGGHLALAFKRSVAQAWAFGRLDTVIVQPSISYVSAVLEQDEIKAWIASQKVAGTWSVYMITGLMVARAASFERAESGGWRVHGGPKVALPAAEAELTGKFGREHDTKSSGRVTTDFIWAVRLAKISRSPNEVILRRDWSLRSYKKGATFDNAVQTVDIEAELDEEGLRCQIAKDEELDIVVVLDVEQD